MKSVLGTSKGVFHMFARKVVSVLSLAALLTVGGAARASADSIYYFTNDSVTGVAGDYGSVLLEELLVPNTVRVTVNLADGANFVDTGSHYAFAFNLVGVPLDTSLDVNLITPGEFKFLSPGGSNITNVPFGNFNYGFACPEPTCKGRKGPDGPLVFTITLAGLTENSFKVKSTEGFYFAADIYSPARNTGTIGAFEEPVYGERGSFGGTALVTPEPASLLLLGTGLLAVGRRFRKKR